MKRYQVAVCGYCGNSALFEKHYGSTGEPIVIGTCESCFKKLKKGAKLKQKYEIDYSRSMMIIGIKEKEDDEE